MLGIFGAGGGGFSQQGSADASNRFGNAGSGFGGINTGTQGVDLTTIAVIGAVVVVALLVLRRR